MHPSITRRLALEHALLTGKFPAFGKGGYYHRDRFYSTNKACISNTISKTKKIEVVVTKKIEVVNRELPDTDDLGKLNPFYISGLADGESSFMVSVSQSSDLRVGWLVALCFSMQLHKRDRGLLERMRAYFGVGLISERVSQKDKVDYRVRSPKELAVVVDHFNKYPLLTQKRADFELFKLVLDLVNRKEHLTPEGLQKIINLRASINTGLSDIQKSAFTNTIPVPRPVYPLPESLDPNWLAGFVDGEGCFLVLVRRSKCYKLKEGACLRFQVTQHFRDAELMQMLASYFGCGAYYAVPGYSHVNFLITKFSDITSKVLPFFEKYPLLGSKVLNYEDFKKAAEIIKAGGHLTREGLDQIRSIKAGMNRGRES